MRQHITSATSSTASIDKEAAATASVSLCHSTRQRSRRSTGKNPRVFFWYLCTLWIMCLSLPLPSVQAHSRNNNHNQSNSYRTNSRGGASKSKQQCLYSLLGVSKTCSPQDLKKAYRRAALRAHPDKPGGNEETFKQVSKAYEVLSDPEQRLRYDQYGFVGDAPNINASPNFGSQSYPQGQGFSFDSSQVPPEFASFFQAQQQQSSSSSSSSFGLDDWLRQMMMGGAANNMNTRPGFGARRPRKRKPVTRPLKVSLADLFLGKTKTVTLSFGRGRTESYKITLKPFWKPGTKISFPQRHTIPPVTFVLEQTPHSTLERRGDDLVFRHRVSDSTTTPSSKTNSKKKKTAKPLRLSIALPDGQVWRRTVPPERAAQILQPGRTVTVPDMGMPTKDGDRGSLIVEFV